MANIEFSQHTTLDMAEKMHRQLRLRQNYITNKLSSNERDINTLTNESERLRDERSSTKELIAQLELVYPGFAEEEEHNE
jgi:hypothetical protein